jgi:metal-responsive CopG/Arc/MetJ family transcriptional regulator
MRMHCEAKNKRVKGGNMPKVSVSISIDTSLLYEIEQLAQKEKKTRTQKITEILTDYIKKTK